MSYNHLTQKERKKIGNLMKEGLSIRSIASLLGRAPSTISREIKRNSTFHRKKYWYFSIIAHELYNTRLYSKKRIRKYDNSTLTKYVTSRLLRTWSPEQVAGRIQLDYPDDIDMRVSHNTIYRWLKEGKIEQAASIKLRHHGHKHKEKRGKFNGAREIKERCRDVFRRHRFGDWELDTIVSSSYTDRSGLLNIVERKSRYCVLAFMKKWQDSKEIYKVIYTTFKTGKLPLHTFTTDRGTEFACYKEIESEMDKPVYFTRPHSPWQKPSVENANGLVREFFPRGTNFGEITPQQVKLVMDTLNNRPRKSLNWKTPAEVIESL